MSSFNSEGSTPYAEPETVPRENQGIPVVIDQGGVPTFDEMVTSEPHLWNPRSDVFSVGPNSSFQLRRTSDNVRIFPVEPESPYEVGKIYFFHIVDCAMNSQGRFVIEGKVLQVYKDNIKMVVTHLHDTEDLRLETRRKSLSNFTNVPSANIILPTGSIILAEVFSPQEDKKGDRTDNVIKNTNHK